MSGALAFAGCLAAVAAVAELCAGYGGSLWSRRSAAIAAAVGAVDALLRLGREGREPGALERRRLLAGCAAASFAAGALLFGALAGALIALGAPSALGRVLRARRLAYRRAVARDAPAIAQALADALSGGHSLRSALAEAAAGLGGPAGAELRRVCAELAAGEPTDAALGRLRTRTASPAIDAIVAASLLHRRSGGDLGRLLRTLARACEDQQRLEDEVRAATAQARFTGVLVVVLPLGGALLAELASPGFAAGIASSPMGAGLVALAVALQLAAFFLIRRLGRVEL